MEFFFCSPNSQFLLAFSGSLDSNNRSLTNNQQTNSSQNDPALPFSRGVSGSGATLDLARKSGLFKKKQTTSDVMKWTKVNTENGGPSSKNKLVFQY